MIDKYQIVKLCRYNVATRFDFSLLLLPQAFRVLWAEVYTSVYNVCSLIIYLYT